MTPPYTENLPSSGGRFASLRVYFILVFKEERIGVLGAWLAYPVGQALLSLIIGLRIVLFKDRSRKGAEAYMLLPKDFGIPEDHRIERSVSTMDEVIDLSESVVPFCLKCGIEKRAANRLALCVEEMAGNVIEYGFADGKPHHLDVRVLVKDGSVVLRMRDNCEKFDLREQAEKWAYDPEHPEKNIGIHMIMRVARDVSYTNTMNTNNLIITV